MGAFLLMDPSKEGLKLQVYLKGVGLGWWWWWWEGMSPVSGGRKEADRNQGWKERKLDFSTSSASHWAWIKVAPFSCPLITADPEPHS